jgi:hypothetical protein
MSMPGYITQTALEGPNLYYYTSTVRNSEITISEVLPQQNSCPWWLRRTSTACPLGGMFGLWCRDFCGPPEGNRPISGWYPCGICIGFDF